MLKRQEKAGAYGQTAGLPPKPTTTTSSSPLSITHPMSTHMHKPTGAAQTKYTIASLPTPSQRSVLSFCSHSHLSSSRHTHTHLYTHTPKSAPVLPHVFIMCSVALRFCLRGQKRTSAGRIFEMRRKLSFNECPEKSMIRGYAVEH